MGMTKPLYTQVITYATRPNDGFDRMMKSFMRIGKTSPVVLGQGNDHSWMDRTKCLYDWCKAHPARMAIHVDAYDTCCVREIPETMDFDGWLTFGAETNCWPDSSIAGQFPPSLSRYKYLNGGTWYGLTDLFVKMVDEFDMLNDWRVDQEYFAKAFLTGRSDIALDCECKFFHNLFLADDDWDTAFGEYYVKSLTSKPYVVHGNGKSDIWKVWDAMGITLS